MINNTVSVVLLEIHNETVTVHSFIYSLKEGRKGRGRGKKERKKEPTHFE